MLRRICRVVFLVSVAGGVVALQSACSPQLVANQIAERRGEITMVFINNTPYRAAFSFGTWDSLDRDPPGFVAFEQLRLDPNTTSVEVSLPCRRNAAIGTQEFVDRVIETEADLSADEFVPEAFDTVVHFSSAPAGSTGEGLPTQGTAEGIERLLGVDYSCEDQLVFTFVQDPDAPGGFRIDYQVIVDTRDE